MDELETAMVPEEIEAVVEAVEAIEAEITAIRDEVFDKLCTTVEDKFKQRVQNRQTKEAQWLRAEKLYLGSLAFPSGNTAKEFFQDRDARSAKEPEFNLVRTKVTNTVAQLVASQFTTGDKNWCLKPTKTATVSQEVAAMAAEKLQQRQQSPTYEAIQSEIQKIAADRCHAMENEIETQLEDASYGAEIRRAMLDYVKLGVGVLSGPTNAAKMRKTYVEEYDSQGRKVYVPYLTTDPRPGVERVDPWLFYPDDSTTDPRYFQDAIRVYPYTPSQLQDLKYNPGFFSENIEECLKEKPRDWVAYWSNADGPASLTEGVKDLWKDRYTVLRYDGHIKRTDLEAGGVDCSCYDENDTLFAEVWVCNGRVIRVSLSAIEGQNEVPYAVDCYLEDPASWAGFGLPMILEDQQKVSGKLWKAVLANAGLSALPITIIDKNALVPAQQGSGYDLQAGKVFLTTEYAAGDNVQNAIFFQNIPSQQEPLRSLMDYTRSLAEEESNMPAVMAGLATPTGAESATGIAIQNQNATAPLFHQSQQWDDKITKRVIRWMYDWNMQFNDNDWIKGDYDVDVQTITQYINRQAAKLDLQAVITQSANDPELGLVVDREAAVRALLTMMKIPSEQIIRSREEVEAIKQQQAQNQQPDPNLMKAQADMMQAENQRKKMEIEEQRLQFQVQQEQQREYWDHLEKMEQYKTRQLELQADLVEKEYDHAIKQLELAIRDESQKATAIVKAGESLQRAQTEKMKIGAQAQIQATNQTLKLRDQDIHVQEMQLRRDTGSGV